MTKQQSGHRLCGQRIATGLGDVPHIRGPQPNHLRSRDLTRLGAFAAAQTAPRVAVVRGAGREPGSDWGENPVPGLALHHLAPKCLPLLEPRHVRRSRRQNPPELEGFVVLDVDQYDVVERPGTEPRSEEHTSELQSLMRISYAVFCLKKKTHKHTHAT